MSDAPPSKFRLKPREFAVENVPASAPAAGPTDVRGHLDAANAAPPGGPPAAPVRPALNDVHALLRDNLSAANAAGLNAVRPVARRTSRRRRDYWLVLTGFDLLIVALVLLLGPNVVSVLFGFAGVVFFNLALTWIMWVLVDDY